MWLIGSWQHSLIQQWAGWSQDNSWTLNNGARDSPLNALTVIPANQLDVCSVRSRPARCWQFCFLIIIRELKTCWVRVFMGAGGTGNSACQFSKVGLCLSRMPPAIYPKKWVSIHKIGGKLGLHSKMLDFFLSKIGISWPKWPGLSGLKKHKIIAWKNFYEK